MTVHSAQGATVEAGHAILDTARTDRSSAYVALTRGRETNRVYLVDDATAAVEVGAARQHADAHDLHHETGTGPEEWVGTPDQAADRLADVIARDRRDHAAHTVLRQAVRDEAARQVAAYGIDTALEHEQIGATATPAGHILTKDDAARARHAAVRAGLRARLAELDRDRGREQPAPEQPGTPNAPVNDVDAALARIRARVAARETSTDTTTPEHAARDEAPVVKTREQELDDLARSERLHRALNRPRPATPRNPYSTEYGYNGGGSRGYRPPGPSHGRGGPSHGR